MENLFSILSMGFIPIIGTLIISYGLLKRAPVYDYFIEGAKKGLMTAIEILPYLIGIFLAVNMFTSCGILSLLETVFFP